MSGTRAKGYSGRFSGRGRGKNTDARTTRLRLTDSEIEIDDPAHIQTNGGTGRDNGADTRTTRTSQADLEIGIHDPPTHVRTSGGRARGKSTDTRTTRMGHGETTLNRSIGSAPSEDVPESSRRSRGMEQTRGSATQQTLHSPTTGVPPPEADMEHDEEMENELLSFRRESDDPHTYFSEERQSNDGDSAHSSRVRGASRLTQAPNNGEDRLWIQPDGPGFIPHHVSRQVMNIAREYFGPWPSWGKVPRETKTLLFEKFREHFNWLPEHEAGIKNSWERANQNVRNNLYRYRKAAERLMGDDVSKWKSVVPSCMSATDWEALCDGPFSDPGFTDKCKKARKNRLTEREGSISKHSGGSISFREHARRMEATEKRPVTELEVYDYCHKRKTGENDYVDKKYKKVRDLYVQEFTSKHGNEPSIDGKLDHAAWLDASGGASKGRIYGFGNTYHAREITESSSTPRSSSLSRNTPITEQTLYDALAKQREETTSLLEEMKRREEAATRREEAAVRRAEEANALIEEMNKKKQEMEDFWQKMKKTMEETTPN